VIEIAGMPRHQTQSLLLKARTSAAGHTEEESMTSFKLFGAAAVLAVLIASPASAEDPLAASEPGMWAFYHPNGDLGNGSARPVANAQAMTPRLVMSHPIVARHAKSRK
jgi:hypothetical protein